MTFRERHFERIRPGSIARVQFRGSETAFTAPVSSLRGLGERRNNPDLSAIERARADPTLTLYLDIPPADVANPEVAAAFCDVGRSAEVHITRPPNAVTGRLFSWFGRADATLAESAPARAD